MFQNWFYVGIVAVALSLIWLVAEVVSDFRAKKSGMRKDGTQPRLAIAAALVAVFVSAGAAFYCHLNIYQDYGAASRADLPRALEALADAEQARKDAEAKAVREAVEREEAEKARLLAEAERQEKLRLKEEKRCGMGLIRSANVTYEVRTRPSETAEKFVNEKASNSRITYYKSIDASTMVRVVGCKDDWREVQITEPSWLTDTMGWVPESVIRDIEYSPGGKRIYVEDDFYWEADTSGYSTQLVSAINRISRETPGCDKIDTASLARSPTKSTPGDPVFFVTCNFNGSATNVWFRPTDQ
ncbi:hypothetical protein [Rhizobium leguminosarum]|uniref:hypothetical protein n=1 Tax=Rhizobium leguminosarum TaxID=384 RepID=UPI0013E3B450|nr:hypothetical protein [Rhizobium leguminosarum]